MAFICVFVLLILAASRRELQGDEWEEKWGERYWSAGRADKWADKWAREGGDVWHDKDTGHLFSNH